MNSKVVNISLLAGCLLMTAVYGITYWSAHRSDRIDPPTITFDEEVLTVSVSADEAVLLEGVQATDVLDGDVTGSLMIESISNLLPGNERIITYVAFGGDHRVGKADRRMVYTDYESPHFSVAEPLIISSAEAYVTDAIRKVEARDCIDGNITNKIVTLGTDPVEIVLGEQFLPIRLQAFNSCGDMAEIRLRVLVQSAGHMMTIRPELTEYLVYLEQGEDFDPRSLLKTEFLTQAGLRASDVEILSDVNTSLPGTYTVLYIVRQDEARAVTPLPVIVQE